MASCRTRTCSADRKARKARTAPFLFALAALLVATTAQAVWYSPSGWQYRKRLILNGALVQGTQTDFPVLIALTDPDGHLRANAQATGNDILFSAGDGVTKLAHEIESYNSTTGALVAWVKVPTLTNGTNTPIFMYYGNAAAANQQNAAGVWSNGYRAVWHLSNNSFNDSTGNGNTCVNTGTANVAGRVGGARDFNGTSGNLNCGSLGGATGIDDVNPMTIEAWFRADTTGENTFGRVYSKSDVGASQFPLNLTMQAAANSVRFDRGRATTDTVLVSANNTVLTGPNAWYHDAAVFDSANSIARMYINGTETSYATYQLGAGAPTSDAAYPFLIGNRQADDRTFDGIIDEVRISGVPRPATWIATGYNNQASQGVGPDRFILSATTEGPSPRLRLVQSGTVTINNGAATATAPLNPVVDTTRAFLVFGVSETNTNRANAQVSGRIAAANQVSFDRVGASGTVTVQWYVAEFASGVSVQRGTANLATCGATCTVTLPTAVNTARSFPIVSQRQSSPPGVFDSASFVRARLTGPTTLVLDAGSTIDTNLVEWQVVEHDAASVQTGNVSFATGQLSQPVTLPTPAATEKSWLLYTYTCGLAPGSCTATQDGAKLVRGLVTGDTTLTFDRALAPAGADLNLSWQLVTFSDATYVQSASQSFAAGGALTADVALPRSVSPAASLAAAGGYTRGGRSSRNDALLPLEGWHTLQLNKPKNLRITRGGNTFASDVGWFVVTFPRYEVYGAASLGALGPSGCPAGAYRSAANLIPNGAFGTMGGSLPAPQPVAASQLTVDPRRTAPAWGWSGDNNYPADTQITMVSGVGCWWGNCGPGNVVQQGAFPGDPGFGLQPTACVDPVSGLAKPNTSNGAGPYAADYPGCWVYGNGNNYASPYKIWETRLPVSLTAGRTYTFVTYASDAIMWNWNGANPPRMSIKKSALPCTTIGGTDVTSICGGTAPTDLLQGLNPTASFAIPSEQPNTSETFNPGEIWTRYQVTFTAATTESVYLSIWDPTQSIFGVDIALAQLGLYTCETTTAVKLASFTAAGVPSGVQVDWETASELDNLGFHLYRGASADGPWTRLNATMIRGLGSSPEGKRYRYVDSGLADGTTYFYRLEDVDRRGKVTSHGPVSATAGVSPGEGGGGGGGAGGGGGEGGPVEPPPGTTEPTPSPSALKAHGEPERQSVRVIERSSSGVTLELETGGFYSRERPDGTTELVVPGFFGHDEPGRPSVPTRRLWLEAVVGRGVRLVSIEPSDLAAFSGLRVPVAGKPVAVVTRRGTYEAASLPVSRREARRLRAGGGRLFPSAPAFVHQTAFQGSTKKAYVELAPLRVDETTGQVILARRLVVRLAFAGRVDDGRPLQRRPVSSAVLARFATRAPGLHAVAFEAIPTLSRPLAVSSLRLSRLDSPVAFHVEPPTGSFGPGSTLYFLAEGTDAAYANEAVYELARGPGGLPMPGSVGLLRRTTPTLLTSLRHEASFETDAVYLPALTEARDLWVWDYGLGGGENASYPFSLDSPVLGPETARLRIDLQGGSDTVTDPDHHVLAFVNGSLVGEARFDGMVPWTLLADVPASLLVPGENTLRLENAGDTGSPASFVYLDRFSIEYAREIAPVAGVLEGTASRSGRARLAAAPPGSLLFDTTGPTPRFLGRAAGAGGLAWNAQASRRYLAVFPGAVLEPDVRPAPARSLRQSANRADWIVIAPEALLSAAETLAAHREAQGLAARAVSLEAIVDQFGFGEAGPHAVRAFLGFAYHHWQAPSPRYVLLLGDASYDPKGRLTDTSRPDLIPAPLLRSTFLWTAADPLYAAVNGSDSIPDLAIGRITAATPAEADAAVRKILDFETAGLALDGKAALVADNADLAGDFEADQDEIASRLGSRPVEKLYLSRLGPPATRAAVRDAFDAGASLVSYVGHGSSGLWASEAILRYSDVDAFDPQPRQPLVLTMTCSNGYFLSAYGNSLAETLVLADGKGAIASFSPSGLSLNSAAHVYHRAVVTELEQGRHERLGDLVLDAQAAYAASGAFPELLEIYHLFGDPGLEIH